VSHNNQLPKGWYATTLQNAVEVHDDLREPVNAEQRAKRPGTIPYYGATGQVGWIDDHLMDGDYVLLGEDGAPFFDPTKPKAYRITGKAWVNNHAHVLRGIEGLTDNQYLTYALNHADYRGYANGTTRLKLTQGAMRRIPLRLAPINEQRRIVAKIDELFSDLDAAVAALERVRAKLKRYRAAVLQAAVTGKLTEEWRAKHPDTEPASKLLDRVLAERRRKWEENQLAKFAAAGKTPPKGWREKYVEPAFPDTVGLPELPHGWCWAMVGQVSEFVRYGSSAKASEDTVGVPVLRMGNIQDGSIDAGDLKYLPWNHAEFPDLLLRDGDLLFNRTNSAELVGKSAVYHGNPNPCSYASYLIGVRMVRGCNPEFVGYYLNSWYGRAWIASVVSQQVGQANVNGTKLQALALPLPPQAEQGQVVAEVELRVSNATATGIQIENDLRRAVRLRQAILKRAFDGKLVPQDPADEPAEQLLQRIRAARNGQSLSERKPRRQMGIRE
jgi:type I restriction enzyme S subunit